MTVAELIRRLQTLGIERQDSPVFVRGYEAGVNDVSELKLVEVVIDDYKGMGYYGQHRAVDEEDKNWILEDLPETVFTKGVQLIGKNRRD
jgi:hypothetical protein